jgi:hypothetical protein
MVLQHIVFAVKFILAVLIPDVPEDIKLAIRRVSVAVLFLIFTCLRLDYLAWLHGG